jgi:TPP-dependent indolepyruvate ferredoxin oxidoreductase alpha subunit
MSSIGDVLGGIRKVLLIEEKVARLEQDVQSLAQDVRRTRDYAESIDGRVKRLEGFIEGVAAASGVQPKLSRD